MSYSKYLVERLTKLEESSMSDIQVGLQDTVLELLRRPKPEFVENGIINAEKLADYIYKTHLENDAPLNLELLIPKEEFIQLIDMISQEA